MNAHNGGVIGGIMSDLIERLRFHWQRYVQYGLGDYTYEEHARDCRECQAADALEAKDKRIAELEAEDKRLTMMLAEYVRLDNAGLIPMRPVAALGEDNGP